MTDPLLLSLLSFSLDLLTSMCECVGLGYEKGRDLRKEMERCERKREGETAEMREIF